MSEAFCAEAAAALVLLLNDDKRAEHRSGETMSEPVAMMWERKARGLPGYVEVIPAFVGEPGKRTAKGLVRILVQLSTGTIVQRVVPSDALRFVHADELQEDRPVFDALAAHWQQTR